MRAVAYLFNRYPEATLTTLRREVHAILGTGLAVHRFAHRPSLQPLAGPVDLAEAECTTYLAEGWLSAIRSVLQNLVSSPRAFLSSLRIMFTLKPASLRNLAYFAMACRLRDELHSRSVDVLHCHFAGNAAAVAMLTRSLGGPPWTMAVHGPEDIAESNLEGLKQRVRAANGTAAISERAADTVRRLAKGGTPVRVVRMGVGELHLAPPVEPISDRRVLCIARFVERKGHAVLLNAVDILKARGIAPVVELIGDGPLMAEVMTEVKRRGLADRFWFRSWQSETQVSSRLDNCMFVVLPSLSEGLPVSIMEAFARARPVIASDVGAVSEILEPGMNGLLVRPADPQALADAMESLFKMERSIRYRMGLRGRSSVEKRYSSAKSGDALLGLWEEVLGKGA